MLFRLLKLVSVYVDYFRKTNSHLLLNLNLQPFHLFLDKECSICVSTQIVDKCEQFVSPEAELVFITL